MSLCARIVTAALLAFALIAAVVHAADPWSQAAYFQSETERVSAASLAPVGTLAQWEARRPELRRQLLEMLGLDPLPPRSELRPRVTGRVERDDFLVEKVEFQSRPGLYVTGNLYLPRNLAGPAPAVLYLCGHGGVKKDGISYGNKVSYQHHGTWFARNGYVCLSIDTLQLGEIEGIHHGTYNQGMWWWNCRGYTPAGVEAWNCMRALDYLETRPEVDASRMGATGRSGGGAYSWWIAALDDRIRAAVPVAGITDLQNHVVDGCVEGHCDCMFFVNTYRWDYPLVAALVAPRALLIANTDRDPIFPLDGVVRTHRAAAKIYALYGAQEKLGLQISPGGHVDSQELQVAAFRWFDRFLQDDSESLAENTGHTLFQPAELKVFDRLPEDHVNAAIHESFTVKAPPPALPSGLEAWNATKASWMAILVDKVFRGWPSEERPPTLEVGRAERREGLLWTAYQLRSQDHVRLPLVVVAPDDGVSARTELHLLDDDQWRTRFEEGEFPRLSPREVARARDEHLKLVFFSPRGVGPTAWDGDAHHRAQIERRYMLLGQTSDGMRVWDTRRAIQALASQQQDKGESGAIRDNGTVMYGSGTLGVVGLYAAIFEQGVDRLELTRPPASHRDGPILLNVLRFLDIPQAVALAADRTQVHVVGGPLEVTAYARAIAAKLHWQNDQVTDSPQEENTVH